MPITDRAGLVGAAEALVPPANVFDNTGAQINTGLDNSADRVIQPASVGVRVDAATTQAFPKTQNIGERSFAIRLRGWTAGGAPVFGAFGSQDCLAEVGTNLRVYALSDSGGAGASSYISNTSVPVGDSWIVVTIYDDAGAAKCRVVMTGVATKHGSFSTPVLNPVVGPFSFKAINTPSSGNAGVIESWLEWSSPLSEVEARNLADGIGGLPGASDITFWADCSTAGLVDYFGAGVIAENLKSSTSVGDNDANNFGYGKASNRSDAIVPKDSSGNLITDGIVPGLIFSQTFSSSVAYVLQRLDALLSLIGDYSQLVSNDIEGGWRKKGAYDLPSNTYLASDAQIDPTVSELRASNFGVGKGYIVQGGGDLTPEIQTFLGIGLAKAQFPNLPESATVIILEEDDETLIDWGVVPAGGGFEYSYQWTANQNTKYRVFKEGLEPLYMDVTHTAFGVIRNESMEAEAEYVRINTLKGIVGADVTEVTVGPEGDRVIFSDATTKQRVHMWRSMMLQISIAWAASKFAKKGHWRAESEYDYRSSVPFLIYNDAGRHINWTGGQFKRDDAVHWLHPDSPHHINQESELVFGYQVSGADAITAEDFLAGLIESGTSLKQAIRLILAALAGKLTGAETGNIRIRDINDTTDRIVAETDQYGNRTTVSTDAD